MKIKKLINFFLLPIFILSLSSSFIKADLSIKDFNLDDVLNSGRELMNLNYGLHHLEDSSSDQNILFVGVHGANSEGYEWIYPFITIDTDATLTSFFRYNDGFCPNSAYLKLHAEIDNILSKNQNIKEVIVMGHSYGAMVVSMFSDKWINNIPLSIHTVAGPLTGPVSTSLRSSLFKNICSYYSPKTLMSNVNFFQWRTIKELDGAFQDLEYDPQVIELQGSKVVRLPKTYNNRRLGHNWSLSWVADQLTK